MVSAIVYSSSTGFTRRYAQLLAERTGLLAYDLGGNSLPPKGSEVFCLGWLRAGSVVGLRKASGRYRVRGVGVVGMSLTPNGKTMEDAGLPAFYLPGGYCPGKLKGVNKVMMGMFVRMMTKKPPKNEEEAAMQKALLEGCDFFDPARLEPVVEFIGR